MNSYRIIFAIVCIFMVVGVFGALAGFTSEGYAFSSDGDRIPKSDEPAAVKTTEWYEVWSPRWMLDWVVTPSWELSQSVGHSILRVPGLGFLLQIATFTVPGMPMALGLAFWLLGVMLAIATIRLVIGVFMGDAG